MKTEADVLKCFADAITKRILLKTVCDLRAIKDTLSGEDSSLDNAWEEICVQLQDEESVFWEAYEEQTEIYILFHIRELKDHEFLALWFQTEEGREWVDCPMPVVTREYYEQMSEAEKADNRCEDDDRIPACYDDVVYDIKKALFKQAMEHSNHRIRNYINRRE